MQLFPITVTDGYKLGHREMYQKGTTMIYSNFTPRSNRLFKGSETFDGKMVVFGIQGFILEFLVETFNNKFFKIEKEDAISKFKRRVDHYLGPNVVPVDGMEALHDLGFLPLSIKALPEGSRVNMKVPVMTITNTHPEFFWLVNYLETVFSNSIWKSMTNASIAFEYRKVFDIYADLTGSPKDFVVWQGHDFSARGMSGPEDATRCGAAHLLSFTGTDTVSAIDYVEQYYLANVENELVAGSVPATEHSVTGNNILNIAHQLKVDVNFPKMSNAEYLFEAEKIFIEKYIMDIVPTGIASYVSDTFDYYRVISEILPQLKYQIMNRDGKLVIRPDSGDPVYVICGEIIHNISDTVDFSDAEDHALEVLTDLENAETGFGEQGNDSRSGFFRFNGEIFYAEAEFEWNLHDKTYYYQDGSSLITFEVTEMTPEQKGSIQVLWETFGGTFTEKGYKLLDSHIGLIYGDSITIDRQAKILKQLMNNGFASANVVLGMGSYTYNYSTRDTFGSAIKATAGIIDEKLIEIYKDPATGSKIKKSAVGLLQVVKDNQGEFILRDQVTIEEEADGELKHVFVNGVTFNAQSLNDIRQRLHNDKFLG